MEQQNIVGYHMKSDNDVARQLYKSVGFVETDEKDGEEIVAVLKL